MLVPVDADDQTRRVDGLVPSDERVARAQLVRVIRDRRARQQQLQHVQTVDQHRVRPGRHSGIVVVAELYEQSAIDRSI